ncbi:high mobility group protein, putative [Trypanosoma brucei gambiense DAL972]|uniref:High mobility group protein, putative n=2 Tax=Trypanosoma brucei TaxID=5691 RepID=C9ZL24_TRYB9|nr:high mobility group protein, putative [Trypanosoma brucei gambiense DAL972]RHW73435.1 high mobility group protein [Trypanosoma brucei equiperdum]CBH10033.1 high mobility group protein, putative [Trypanosoma brucei gambiense DAL972]|eukprot:XP_011772323.1 high mobility group protein, putative [Trypanosoma brucei gambiense DAL972]
MATELKKGPLPTDIEETVITIMREEGVRYITAKILRMRLESKYQMEFGPHKAAIDDIVARAMQRPEFKKQLELALKEKDASKSSGGKGSKRARSAGAEAPSKTKKEMTEKPKKPADYPKPAVSSYLLFVADQREDLKAKNPGMQNTAILQTLGKMWSDASDDVKEHYRKKAEEDKARFRREVDEYKRQGGKEYGRGGKIKKDSNAPKRAMTSFMFFSSDFRSKHSDLSIVEMSKAAGAAWKELGPEERKVYEEMAEKDKERYKREMAALPK